MMSQYPFIDLDVPHYEKAIERYKEQVENFKTYCDKNLNPAILIDMFMLQHNDVIETLANCVVALKRAKNYPYDGSQFDESTLSLFLEEEESIADYPATSTPQKPTNISSSVPPGGCLERLQKRNAAIAASKTAQEPTTKESSSISLASSRSAAAGLRYSTSTIARTPRGPSSNAPANSQSSTSAARNFITPPRNSAANAQASGTYSRYPSSSTTYGMTNGENARSFIIKNLCESKEFDVQDKKQSDLADVRKIFGYLGIEFEVKNNFRFEPASLQSGHHKYLKVELSTEEQKKKFMDATNGKLLKIRALDQRFRNIEIRDAVNLANERNGYGPSKTTYRTRSQTYDPWNTSISSFQSNKSISPPNRASTLSFKQPAATSSYIQPKQRYTKGRPGDLYTSDEEEKY